MGATTQTTCPGCGLTMPVNGRAVYDGYYHTSAECWSVYTEVLGFVLTDKGTSRSGATMAFMTSAVVPYLVTGQALERTGNIGYSGQPTSAVFVAGDGHYLSLGVVQQSQFELLAKLLDRLQWLDDKRFCSPDARRNNADLMQHELSAVLRMRDAGANL